jgi:succinate dehydrogenase/fumarate reductase flavoprotein subunit
MRGTPPEWPYAIQYGGEQVVETDVLVLGGGIAGCWADISAARQGVKRLSALECGARKASCKQLDFRRVDYPQMDPPEWNKFLTIKLQGDKVKVGELPHGYFGDLKKNYEAHNRDYTGVWQG